MNRVIRRGSSERRKRLAFRLLLPTAVLGVVLGATLAARDGGSTAPKPTTTRRPSPSPMSEQKLASLRVNELGRVPVIEWHEVGEAESRWKVTRKTFKEQLQRLYDGGYRPVTVADFADGRFDIPAGTTPVVLTFDDADRQQFYFGENGQPHPDSVVGILRDFARTHPGWRETAAFYIYWPLPFREKDRVPQKLKWLVDNGYELGNHSYGHDNLSSLDDEEVQQSLARLQEEVEKVIPRYRLRSHALPFGLWPKDRSLAVTGIWEGKRYKHDVVLLVGDEPAYTPHHTRYDPTKVMRVQAFPPEFDKWLNWLDSGPRRFVSDGDAATISYPRERQDQLRRVRGFSDRAYGSPGPAASSGPPATSGPTGSSRPAGSAS
ncbi:MAG TPA: polysaccharide deacetylase family protein [Actinomycetota bacterium]|nr:polysaccharide deacetylase family protein [Actinomycetota bacterium]